MNMNAPLPTAQAVTQFALAGNATLTIRSLKTGSRFTYRIRKSEDGRVWFVSYLRGAENDSESSYQFLGTIKGDKSYAHGRKSRIAPDAPVAKAFEWFEGKVIAQQTLPEQIEVWHEGRCGRCNRKLTVPESIEHGFGPECVKHVFIAEEV